MDRQTLRTLRPIIGVVAVLMFIAPSFDILPRNIGTFTGIALLMISGTLYALPKQNGGDKDSE
jgi:hypothetical protein